MKWDRRTSLTVATAALFTGTLIGYRSRHAFADGPPATTPLYYSGTMIESGNPVNGARDLAITIWDDATATAATNRRCMTNAPATTISAGRFRVALDDSCTSVVHSTPDLWIEVLVGGESQGRAKLGAAPYALESGRASDLVPQLRQSLVPAGSVMAFAGSTPPAGWLLCDGRPVDRAAHAALFAAIGEAYGAGDGMTTFALPDLRGRVAVGRGMDPQVDALADSDGLGVAGRRMSHRHGRGTLAITGTGSSAHQHLTNIFQGFGSGTTPANSGSQNFGGYTSNFDNTLAGQGGHGHANGDFSGEVGDTSGPLDAPAFQVLNYIIKE